MISGASTSMRRGYRIAQTRALPHNSRESNRGGTCTFGQYAGRENPALTKLVAKYGEKLVALRYRYDAAKGKRYKTIELIIAEEDWTPPPPHAEEVRLVTPTHAYSPPPVPVRIHYLEKDLQRQLKSIGGTWDAGKKLWYAPEEHVHRIGLSDRIAK